MSPQLLMTVARSVRLTGLGVLALAREHQPVLRQFALHTKLLVTLTLPGGRPQTLPASVEELSRPVATDAGPTHHDEYVLLLESELVDELPAGTEIWWAGSVADAL